MSQAPAMTPGQVFSALPSVYLPNDAVATSASADCRLPTCTVVRPPTPDLPTPPDLLHHVEVAAESLPAARVAARAHTLWGHTRSPSWRSTALLQSGLLAAVSG